MISPKDFVALALAEPIESESGAKFGAELVVRGIAAPRAGIFAEGAKPSRSRTRRTTRLGDKAIGEKAKRGGAMPRTTSS